MLGMSERDTESCSEASSAAGEPLAGTASDAPLFAALAIAPLVMALALMIWRPYQ